MILFFILNLATSLALPVSADSGSYGQYGQYGQPAPSEKVLIDKMVSLPIFTETKGGVSEREYVDNLSPSDQKYRPGQQVYFQIKVKNPSDSLLENITVKDYLPDYLEPIQGPGDFDPQERVITFTIDSLGPNEEKIFYLLTEIFPQDQLPADQGLICLTNRVEVNTNQTSDEDSSQFCLEKEVLGAEEVPQAGPELGLFVFGIELTALASGVALRKMGLRK